MLVTINTDASYHTKKKWGGYAFWAISNDFKITKSGLFRFKCKSSDDAEIKCIINSLKTVLYSHENIHKVIINTDSLNAIGVLTKDNNHIRKYVRLYVDQYKNLQSIYDKIIHGSKNNVTIEFRHVKAHTGVNDKRSFVNEWCDNEAKKHMWNKINSNK